MPQPLRVMHVVYDLGAGGMENGVINLCNLLEPSAFSTSICTLASGGAMEPRLNREKSELLNVKRHFGNDVTVSLRLAKEIRRRRIDILHSHGWPTFLESWLALKFCRVSKWVHGEHGTLMTRRRHLIAQRRGWSVADSILSVSTALADRIASEVNFPREMIQVIPNGVDTDKFAPARESKESIRSQCGLPTSGFIVGMIARFVPFKDHQRSIRAIAELNQQGIDAHLALAGSGPLQSELEALASELGVSQSVHFLGVSDQVHRLLNAFDVLVSSSSHNEGMSNSILEAMSAGVPVVATRVAASEELLEPDGTGVLIPPRDTKALVDALKELAVNPERVKQLGSLSRKRAVNHFSIKNMVDSYADHYLTLTERRAACSASH